jgi:predicted nucleic acid-binding protein
MAEGDRASVLFLDTNILMYAVGKEHLYREPCRGILRQIAVDELIVVTNVEVLQELLHRYRSLGKPDLASALYTATKDLCEEVFAVTAADIDRAHEILRISSDVSVRDAVHAATALRRGIGEILSTDQHFESIEGITRVDPTTFLR